MLVRLTMFLIRRPICCQTAEGVDIVQLPLPKWSGTWRQSVFSHCTLYSQIFWYTLLESLRRPNETLKQFGDGEGNVSKEIIQTSNLP